MKKLVLAIGLLTFLAGCGMSTDKQAELAQLLKERDLLNEKITKLQAEISKSDTGSVSDVGAKNVVTTEIQPAEFNHYIEIQGKVDGDENIGVNPMMPGVVSRILVKVGQRVSKGQLLLELDAEVVRQNLKALKDQLDFATTVYLKQKSLWDQKIGSEIQYLSAKNNKESLENSIKTLEETLRMSQVTSPIQGTVEDIPVKIGQAVSPGIPAIRVINFSRIKVVAELAESYATRVKNGDVVKLFFPDYNKEIEARISFASKYINPVNRTFQVEAHLNSPDLDFKANMIAVMKINDYSAKEALAIPVNAIQKSSQGSFLFLARDEKGKTLARKQEITLGSVYNGLAEVTSGLSKGDRVITMGYQDLYDGQAVKF